MIKEGSENKHALIHLIFFLNHKSYLSLKQTIKKWGKISLWNVFLNTCWTQLFALLMSDILMSKIPLKDVHIHNFEHSRVIMNMKLSSHGFLFHRNINRRENKA